MDQGVLSGIFVHQKIDMYSKNINNYNNVFLHEWYNGAPKSWSEKESKIFLYYYNIYFKNTVWKNQLQ